MLLSPLVFTARLGSALTTFASVVLDSSNKGNACASAHPLGKNIVQSSPFAILTSLHMGILQKLAILR